MIATNAVPPIVPTMNYIPQSLPNSDKVAINTHKEIKLEQEGESDGIFKLPVSGFRVKLGTVPHMAFTEIQRKYNKVSPPLVDVNEDGMFRENKDDPDYIKALQEEQLEMMQAITKVTAVIGVELVDEIPKSGISKMRFLGYLEGYDESDKDVIESLYKTKVLFSNNENIKWLMSKLGVSQEAIDERAATFPGN